MTPSPQPDQRLRALMTTLDFPPSRGGIQTMAREILTRARLLHYRVVAPVVPGPGADPPAAAILRARRLLPGARGLVPGVAMLARREIRRTRPDVVLAMHVLAAPGPLSTRTPTVVVVHGGELRSARIGRVARALLPRAAAVVANSAYTASLAATLGADPARTTVIPVGAPDVVKVAPSDAENLRRKLGGGRIVLSVGRLVPHKGHEVSIRALRDLPDDVRLVIVGEGAMRGGLMRTAAEEGVADRVVFTGEVSDEDLRVHYAAADAFALLSRTTSGTRSGAEGGGIVLLEALAAGLPIVAAATGGIPETIRDGETGLLVDPDDRRSVVDALRRIITDTAAASRLAAAGRALATGERSWTNFVDRIESVLIGASTEASTD